MKIPFFVYIRQFAAQMANKHQTKPEVKNSLECNYLHFNIKCEIS